MSLLDRRAEEAQRRRATSLAASVVVHVAVVLLVPRHATPPELPVQLELVALGEPDRPVEPTPSSPEPPTPAPVAPAAEAGPDAGPPEAPDGDRFAALRRPTQPRRVRPVPPRPPAPARSFQQWQHQRYGPLTESAAAVAAGSEVGQDRISHQGRNRCDPISSRRAEIIYLLLDASGSMNRVMRSQALGCAHQYAASALDRGAEIVVGSFALDAHFSPPLRDLLDVEAALRAPTDSRGTVLPTRELAPFFDANADRVADLVIITDGWFEPSRQVQTWYRYFLELNAENRGIMYTVGVQGSSVGVAGLQDLGFDVHMYDPLGRSTTGW